MHDNSHFLWMMYSVDTSRTYLHLTVSNGSGRSSTVDVTGRWLGELYGHDSTIGFLLLQLECGKCDTNLLPIRPRASPTTLGKGEEQLTQLIRNKEKVKKQILIGLKVRRSY